MADNQYTFENEQYRKTYWHTCSHILAQAVKHLYPDVKLAIGPAIDNGFYYDIDSPTAFTPEILTQIEAEMRKICKEKLKLERFELPRNEALELMKDDLEADYEAAKESGDLELAAGILDEIEGIRAQIQGYKLEMKEKIQNMHEVMKQQYTAEEWANLQAAADALSADPSLTVLPVENVYFTGGMMKFDTPPVIKDGRTLIPIRAISAALEKQDICEENLIKYSMGGAVS